MAGVLNAPVVAARVLIVEDDPTVAEVVARYLLREGYQVEAVADGAVGLERALADPPDLVVLDLMLPSLGGLELCRRLRAVAPVPVIMLTARGEEADRIAGLELGADDYVAKPFSPRELTARVKAVLRRAAAPLVPAEEPGVLSLGGLEVDVVAHEGCLDGALVVLTAKEFDLLAHLMRHPRRGRWRLLALGVAGLSAAALVAAAGGIPAGEAVRLVVQSCLGAAVTGLIISGLLFVLRGRPLGVQVAVTAFAPVLAVALGVAWAASQMFITSHDLWVLWVVLVGAGTVGLVVALLLGRRVADVSASVGEMARRLGEEGPGSTLVPGERRPPGAGPHELPALAAQLEETSARLADAQAQAAALERSRRELVSWVSHDLRTPLAGIRAMVEALEDRVVDDPETVVVHAALGATATQAEVWVQDGCGGIPEGDLDLVFELAYRGDVAPTPGDGGAGLGLAVARGLVEAHHGDINVRNQGAGCRFTVTLPCPRGEVG